MPLELVAVIGALALAGSTWLTLVVRRFALAHGVLDVPNERSSHTATTPRAGGIAVVVTTTFAFMLLVLLGASDRGLLFSGIGGGMAVALVGYFDDRYRLPAKVRLLVHFAAAVSALLLIGGPTVVQVGDRMLQLGWLGDGLAVIGIVWMLNLFNFMDGIDGIAASEAVFVACGGTLLIWVYDSVPSPPIAGLVFGAACFGFLVWNWPPAKIFMGDVGSGYIGYMIGLLALATMRASPSALWIWLILTGTFVVDATVTLVRRMVRGERIYEAHRTHAYQWLARRWDSHKKVTVAVAVVNMLWLLPCAALASIHPVDAPWIALIALTPLIFLALVVGAGRIQQASSR